MRTVVTDLRGRPRWTAGELTRRADIFIVSDNFGSRVGGQRTLAYINPAALWNLAEAGTASAYNIAMARLPVLDFPPIWTSDDGLWSLKAVDITQRGVVSKLAKLCVDNLAWADGVEICYYDSLDWIKPGKYPVEFWQTWNDMAAAWADEMKRLRPNWVVVAQQFHLTGPIGATNGLYLEQSPYSFGYTLANHSADLSTYMDLMRMADAKREVIWVAEIREPWKWGKASLEVVKQWAADPASVLPPLPNGVKRKPLPEIYLSCGRDATGGWPI